MTDTTRTDTATPARYDDWSLVLDPNTRTWALRERCRPVACPTISTRPVVVVWADVLAATSRVTGVAETDIMSHRHNQIVVRARHLAWHVYQDVAGASTTALGEIVGRDHSSIVVANQRLAEQMLEVPALVDLRAAIMRMAAINAGRRTQSAPPGGLEWVSRLEPEPRALVEELIVRSRGCHSEDLIAAAEVAPGARFRAVLAAARAAADRAGWEIHTGGRRFRLQRRMA